MDGPKGKFLREFLASNRDANADAVNAAWNAEGHEGGISESLISKIKSELGLTSRRRTSDDPEAEARKRSRAKAPERAKRRSRRVGQVPSLDAEQAALRTNGLDAPSRSGAAARHGDDDDVLDELEEGIDELIQRIRDLGGRSEVVKALKRARRLLVRSHEG